MNPRPCRSRRGRSRAARRARPPARRLARRSSVTEGSAPVGALQLRELVGRLRNEADSLAELDLVALRVQVDEDAFARRHQLDGRLRRLDDADGHAVRHLAASATSHDAMWANSMFAPPRG